MKVVVLNGSPRPQGNTAHFAEAFKKGAEGAGHEVTVFRLAVMKIAPCLGCQACKNGRECVQKDDWLQIRDALREADVLIWASPIYFWNLTPQLLTAVSRIYGERPKAKKYGLILSSGAVSDVHDAAIYCFRNTVRYLDAEEIGIKIFTGYEQLSEENLKEVEAFGASL